MYKFIKDEKGSVTVLVSLLVVALMGMLALVTDVGVVYAEKAKLSKAIDAAILAGGQELPGSISAARTVMETYLVANGVDINDVTITIAGDGKSASIVATKQVDHYFAKVLGFNQTGINETSKIELGNAASAVGGIRPFGVTKYDFQYGDQVVLKTNGGDGYHGNFGGLALGGSGACNLIGNALYGYESEIKVGDYIDTEPGNMASMINPIKNYIGQFNETFETFDRNSGRVWTVLVVDSMEVNGRSAVEVVGFAQFFVEEIKKKSGKAQITGRFVRYVTNGDIDHSLDDTGVYAMRLVN